MGQICVMHGVIAGFDARQSAHRGLFDRQAFVDFLHRRTTPFVPLMAALRGDGDALTVDDAIHASAEAATAARELGHAVTLFVNASYVEERREHYFYVLNTLFDRLPAGGDHRVRWGETMYDVARPLQRSALRRVLKAHLQALPDDEARLDALRELGARIGVTDASLPPYLRTLTHADIRTLLAQGVDVQNHGWTHADLTRLPIDAQREEVEKGRAWLEATFGIQVEAYAVPFGTPQPEPSLRETLREAWLCANDRWGGGTLAPGVWNRMSLNLFGSAWKGAAVTV